MQALYDSIIVYGKYGTACACRARSVVFRHNIRYIPTSIVQNNMKKMHKHVRQQKVERERERESCRCRVVGIRPFQTFLWTIRIARVFHCDFISKSVTSHYCPRSHTVSFCCVIGFAEKARQTEWVRNAKTCPGR